VNIILEGPDGGGKSTLASFLASELRYRVHASEGPIRHDRDMLQRYTTYLLKRRTIFDRLALISEPIYGPLFQRRPPTDDEMKIIWEFYRLRPLIIYCRPIDAGTGMSNHRATSSMDSSAYMAMVNIHYPRLLGKYDAWAKVVQPMRYEIGEDLVEFKMRLLEKLDAVAV
jgi:hypothetical protein